ncbi:MAG: xanthine dehydrogenase family protein subunit M [Planctomycetota bacterium]
MHIPDIELHEVATLEESASLMSRLGDKGRLLAGGTDLLVDLKTGRATIGHAISINRVDGLRGVSQTRDGLRIGALTTITQLSASDLVRKDYAPILDATSKMANPQIRNIATVGGNIASAVPCADTPPILTAMNASVRLWSAEGEREVPLDAFFTGPRQTVMRQGEVLTAILLPKPPPGFGAAYARFQLREGNTIAVAAVAVGLRLNGEGTVQDARVVLGAVSPTPKLVSSAGVKLVGRPLDEEAMLRAADVAMDAAEPISDVRGSADFRRKIVGVMTHRAIQTAHDRAQGHRKEVGR